MTITIDRKIKGTTSASIDYVIYYVSNLKSNFKLLTESEMIRKMFNWPPQEGGGISWITEPKLEELPNNRNGLVTKHDY